MPGSDDAQIFPVEKKEGILNPENIESPAQTAPESETGGEERETTEERETPEESTKNEDQTDKGTVCRRESEGEEEEGFTTPTSSDHRIPPNTQCPSPPKKPRPPPSKLKRRSSIQADSSADVESIFHSIGSDQDDERRRKIKKARTESDEQDRL